MKTLALILATTTMTSSLCLAQLMPAQPLQPVTPPLQPVLPTPSPQQMEQYATISSAAPISSVRDLKFHWLAPSKPTDWRNNREPVEGLSPQSWTTIVGWHPGQSAFPDGENFSTEMPLLWIGHEPWQ